MSEEAAKDSEAEAKDDIEDDDGRPSVAEIIELEALPSTVAEVMTSKVITVSENDTVHRAEGGMQQFRFRHLPVADESGKLIGLVTHSDILHASSSWLSESAQERDNLIHQLPVGKIMQREVITVRAEEKLLAAAKLMWEARLGCLPVVDENDHLVGILTEGDFIKLTIRLLAHGRPPPPPSAPPPA